MALPGSWSREDVLALSLVRGLQSIDLRSAVEQCESLEQVLHSPPPRLERILRQQDLFSTRDATTLRQMADECAEKLAARGGSFVTLWDDAYPALLREIAYPPAVLYLWGTLPPPDALMLAIVGTRRCTTYGRLCTERFAEGFARAGCVVVSGLATGIDSIAHRATLDAGGITVAIVASGIDRISPRAALQLAERIVSSGGAVLSEYPPGITAQPAYFPQRNRIISGIARAVLVVESRQKGGSLITAQFALDQSRELFAVPGNITSPTSEGTNLLIAQQKATLALSPEQVLEELGIAAPTSQQEHIELLSELEQQLWDALSGEPQSADDLAATLGLPIGEVLSALLMMEFRSIVRQLPGKQFIRAR